MNGHLHRALCTGVQYPDAQRKVEDLNDANECVDGGRTFVLRNVTALRIKVGMRNSAT